MSVAMQMMPYQMHEQCMTAVGVDACWLRSQTWFDCTLVAYGSGDTMTVPVQNCSTCMELKQALAYKQGFIDPYSITFMVKNCSSTKLMKDTDRVARKMIVKGVKNFQEPRHEYPHPYGIIGAGYNGIKTALILEHHKQQDYCIFDRYDRVGGHCWLEAANKTTRLQTEFACYHVWFGPEWSSLNMGHNRCGGVPTEWEYWPTRDRLLEHFQICAEEWGIIPHCKFNTDIEAANLIGKVSDPDRYFEFQCVPKTCARKDKQGGGAMEHQISLTKQDDQNLSSLGYAGALKRDKSKDAYTHKVSCFAMWPGCLTNPRQMIYKGEENFGGYAEYGVEMRFDYNEVRGKRTVIHGHGAFTMENVRSCFEHHSKKVYVVCRKRNLTCPRVVSWFINQANPGISAAQCLNMLKSAYKLCNYDPWDMHSVSTNSSRTHATLNAKTRFGIGDIYFLACGYGVCEIVVDNIKRLTPKTVHLESGDKLEEIDNILKCTGMLPDFTVDKVIKCKYLQGFWINGDNRRFLCADPDGLQCSTLSTTTVGPGAYGNIKMMKHFWDVPGDWLRLEADGSLDMLPKHYQGEPTPDTPAYFIEARHAVATGLSMGGMSPLMSEKNAGNEDYKHWMVNYCSPIEKFIDAAKQEWDKYEDMFREYDIIPKDTPRTPYLYTVEWVAEQRKIQDAELAAKTAGFGSARGY